MPDSIDAVCDDGRWWVEHGNLGYDQGDRWTWRDSGYQTGTEVDCSSFVISLLQKHGYDTGDASYTGNMSDELCAHGWVRLPNDGSPQRGDILLNDSRHVAMYIGDGLLIQASCGEPGHCVIGGEAGDQTDHETNCSNYYNEPWDCYLRYAGDTSDDSDNEIQPTANRGDRKMECIITNLQGTGVCVYFDGARIHDLTDPDDINVLNAIHNACFGEDIPCFQLDGDSAPWTSRLYQAIYSGAPTSIVPGLDDFASRTPKEV